MARFSANSSTWGSITTTGILLALREAHSLAPPPTLEERRVVLQHKGGSIRKTLPPQTRSSFAPDYRRLRSLRLRACGLQRPATYRRTAAERHATRCASRALCAGGAPRRYPPSKEIKTSLR